MSNLSTQILNQEKVVKSGAFTVESKNIFNLISLLKEDRVQKLIKSNDDREMNLLIGELRSYDKLLSLIV